MSGKKLLNFMAMACLAKVVAGGTAPPPDLKSLSLEELSQIEVTTASRGPEKVLQTAAAVYVISGEDIRRSGVTSIPDALRMAPGVEVARIDSHQWSVGIRGFGSNLTRSVLVLIDGRTVYTTLLAGTYWDVQNTNMDDIDRIEVIRGPGGTIWGPNAVNGVINILTKNSKDTHGLMASLGGGNAEQGFANVRYGGGNDKGLDFRVYGMGFTRSPEDHSDGHNFDDWRTAQGGFRIDWVKDSNNTFTLQGDMYSERAGESVSAVSYTAPYSQILDANAQLSGGNIMGRWTRKLSAENDIQVQVYYDRTDRREPNFIDLRNTFDIDFLQHLRWTKRQRLTWGLGTRFSLGDNPIVVSGLTFTPQKRTDSLYTGFFQDEISLVEGRLSLTLGTKALRTNYLGLGLEPSARLLWKLGPNQSVWTSFTHSLRTPSDGETNFNLSGYLGTTSSGEPYFARFIANPQFAPEQVNGYEAGYRRLLAKKLYVDVAAFFNHYHDLFSEEVIGGTFVEYQPGPTHLLLPAQFRNGLLGNTIGGEIAPEWSPTSIWRLRTSYAYLNMNLKKSPQSADLGTAPIVEGSSPRHQVDIQSSFNLSKTVSLDLTYRYVGALPALSVPAYSSADVRVAWRLSQHLELSLVGQNLLQPEHFEFSSDPGPLVGIKRSAYAKITWAR
jgi:iron complex outermembrane receptor protein